MSDLDRHCIAGARLAGSIERDNRAPIRIASALLCLLAIVLQSACSRDEPLTLEAPLATLTKAPAFAIVATVADQPVTARALRRAMAEHGGEIPGRFETAGEKEAVLDELIRTHALAALALNAGYDKDPEIQEAFARVLSDKYWVDYSRSKIELPAVSDEEVKQYYEAHLGELRSPERVRASIILVTFPPDADDRERARTRERVADLWKELTAEQPGSNRFSAAARRVSNDRATADRGGDVGWLAARSTRTRLEAEVVEAAFEIGNVGTLAPPLETRRGVYLIMLTGRSGSEPQPLAEAAPSIRRRLEVERLRTVTEQHLRELVASVPVVVHRDVLDRIGPPTKFSPSDRPPAFPVSDGNDDGEGSSP